MERSHKSFAHLSSFDLAQLARDFELQARHLYLYGYKKDAAENFQLYDLCHTKAEELRLQKKPTFRDIKNG